MKNISDRSVKSVLIALAVILIMIGGQAGSAAAQKRFYNKEFKFGFGYPARAKLERDPDAIASGKNLKGLAYITLNHVGRGIYSATAAISAGNVSREACQALSTAEDDKPRNKKFGTTTFTKTAYVEGGMESVHPVEFYRIYRNNTCYEIQLMVGMEKYSKHPINDLPAFEQLYVILRSFYFR